MTLPIRPQGFDGDITKPIAIATRFVALDRLLASAQAGTEGSPDNAIASSSSL